MAGAGRSRHQPGLVQGHKEEGQGRVPAEHRPPKQLGNPRHTLGYRPRRAVAEVEHEAASIACRPAMCSCQAMVPKPPSAGLPASMSVGTPGRARFQQPGA
eukprot:125450-Chlamydomonas_euryale.AAC.1